MLIREKRGTQFWAVIVSLSVGLLYYLSAARDIVVGDTPELITVAVTLGVAHSPGYPLFTMLGHLFSLLPLGPLPFRVNLLSVICNAATAGVVFLTAIRLTQSRLAAAVAGLVLGLDALFWTWSLAAEVFPLNNLLAATLIYLLVNWYNEPERTGVLIAAPFVAGLALSNHQTIVLLGPAVCVLLWQRRSALRTRPQVFFFGIFAFLAGLLPYAYVPWAAAHHPLYNWGGVTTWRDLLALITRQSYGGRHLVAAAYQGGSSLQRIAALCFSFSALLSVLSLLGLIQAYRRHRWYFWFSLLAFIFTGPFFIALTNLNLNSPSAAFVLERFFVLPEVVVAPLTALGAIYLAERIAAYAPSLPIRPLSMVGAAIAVILTLGVATNYRRIDRSHNHVARLYAQDLLRTAQPDAILLVTGDGLALPPIYLNLIDRVRPDVTIIVPPLLPAYWYVHQLRERDSNLHIPFDYYDRRRDNIKMLVEANPGRPMGIVGPIPDKSLEQDYWARLLGLINAVEPKSRGMTLNQLVIENEQLIKSYHPPSAAQINAKGFESEILAQYAQPEWRIGNEFERAGSVDKAQKWYRNALAIDPNFVAAREALERIH